MGHFRIGSIFGLEIRIDYSWFVIVFLILWTFAFGVFPARYPQLPTGAHLAMGVAGTALFFASLLAHELSHSLVARSREIPVDGITLFIFGGMAHTRAEFEDPQDELVIAGAGPLASLAIAGLFALIAWGGAGLGWSAAVTGVAGYLAYLNVILAVFNLFPGYPLDGGRLLRAFLWKRTGDLTRATRTASKGGKVLGYVLIGLGLLQFLAGNPIGGIWFVFIGWFVRTAAEAGYLQHLLRRFLEGLPVRRVMQPPPEGVPADMMLQSFAEQYLLRSRSEEFAVEAAGRTVGFITVDQLRKVPRGEWSHRSVAEVMAPVEEQVVVAPQEPMSAVLEKLQEPKTARVLVASDGGIEGVITTSDLSRLLTRVRMLQGP